MHQNYVDDKRSYDPSYDFGNNKGSSIVKMSYEYL